MTDAPAAEFAQFIAAERDARRLPPESPPLAVGEISHAVVIEAGKASELLRLAARRAAGLFASDTRNTVLWVEGDSELAIHIADLRVKIADGLIDMAIPVSSDQTGGAVVEVLLAVGSPKRPAGLYASTFRRPNGPPLIVERWSEALVAFAWQCVLEMITGIAGAVGKDQRGNVLVPVEMAASARGLEITPMARHRFAGSTGLGGRTNRGPQ